MKKLLIILLFITSLFSSETKTKNILLLHTYDYQYPWTKSIFEGMDFIEKESKIPVKFYTEQIDFEKIDLEDKERWIGYFSKKYKNIKIDGIVVIFRNAIKFINKYEDLIFKDIPKVAYGHLNLKNDKNLTFLKLENDLAIENTVKVALSQNKDVKNIYILGNKGNLSEPIQEITIKSLNKYSSIKPEVIPNLTANEIKNKLSKVSKNSIIFYCLYLKDKNGLELTPKKYLEEFSKVSNAPIYSYFSALINSGTVGGYVTDSKLLIQNMVKVLLGTYVLKKENFYSVRPMFDYNALERYNIQEVPKESLVLNKPINYFKIEKNKIIISSLIFIIFLFSIILYRNKKRKKSLEKEIKEEFNRFFELSINLQVIADVKTSKVIQINSASKNILGFEPNELINTIFLDLVYPDDIQETIDEMGKLANGEKIYYFENRFRHKNGNYVNLAWSAITDGQKKLIFATAQDKTKIKLIEQERKEQERLLYQNSKMAAMGEMLANIAHQWRQPLSVISSAATGAKIQNSLGLLTGNNLNSYFDTINNKAQHLSQTIEDFRTFFSPKTEEFKEFNIEKTIEKTLSLIKSQFIKKEIEIIKNIEDETVFSLENELIQALINIFNNSKDALDKIKGNKYLFINIQKENSMLIIEIIDNAGGIPEDILDRIFEPYFTTKHQSIGTGIGLYMTREITIKLLNGTIKVNNKNYDYKGTKYKGASFKIKLPIKNKIQENRV